MFDQSARQLVLGTTTLDISDYAMQHAEYYGLRKTGWKDGQVVSVELALYDANDTFIDEGGCNCDLDGACNNPRCVMERGVW